MRLRFLIILCTILVITAGCTKETSSTSNPNDSETKQDGVTQTKSYESADLETKNIKYGPANPAYKMDVTYDDKKHQISGTLHVAFDNNLDKTLNHIYFNLWPNAKEFKNGGIQVDNVLFNEEPVEYEVKDTKLDISEVSLKTGKSASVNMDFTVTIPEQQHRFGWTDTQVSLGNWFPILAVYDDEGWNLDPYFAGGDPTYSLTSNFDVTLTASKEQNIITTGQSVGNVTSENGMNVHQFKAENVRDFAIVMNKSFNHYTEMVNGIKVNVVVTEAQKKYATYMLDTAKYALPLYEELFGEYPWPELDIVGMNISALGMEYPQLVMINLDKEPERSAIYGTTEHEIAHQWFYGVVGNNQFDEPWLDESFATFAHHTAFFGEQLDYTWVRAIGKKYYRLTSAASVFMEHAEDDGMKMYQDVMYDYGAKTLYDLQQKLGDDLFYKGMQTYFEKMKFKVATTADFVRIMQQSSGEDLSAFFRDHRVRVSDTR
ncbi:M1 family metallopeptidase [Virgibacillus flavescens]|uniref:M1 family metallopeptidase n=1 Tax=Virgibacillus flavescens TaxID=1611422 RepID=UPI003D334352